MRKTANTAAAHELAKWAPMPVCLEAIIKDNLFLIQVFIFINNNKNSLFIYLFILKTLINNSCYLSNLNDQSMESQVTRGPTPVD